jgi:hypothetical protein
MMLRKTNALFHSKRFWIALSSALAIGLEEYLGINLQPEQIMSIGMIIAGWLVGETFRASDK